MRWAVAGIAVLAACLVIASVGSAQAPSVETSGETPFERRDVREVCEQIVCYCGCPHLQVSKCFCGTADAIREQVAGQLDSGMTPEEIIAAYVEEHGTYGLAAPPREGFNWIVWVGPFVFLLTGFLFTAWLASRWRKPTPALAAAGAVPDIAAEEVDPRHREALARALDRMD